MDFKTVTDKNTGIIVFIDAIFETEFDDCDSIQRLSNDYRKSTIKSRLDEWFDHTMPDDIKKQYYVDLLEDYEIFDTDQLPEKYRRGKQLSIFADWHSRVKGLVYDHCSTWWWTKTPVYGSPHLAVYVNPMGDRNTDSVARSFGVVPCLRPKKISK